MILQQIIDRLYDLPSERMDMKEARQAIAELKTLLNCGDVRAAEKLGGTWRVNAWVKKGILLAFRIGAPKEFPANGFQFFDKDTMAVKHFTLDDGVRIVPGGSVVRDGAFVASGAVVMPPAYVNIGAYVDEGTMIDSHALVGSCAQVGRRVHISAAAQIGGVLEPIGSLPVIVEDEVFIGGNAGVYEGTIVRRRAVIGAGVILTRSTPVYDLVYESQYRASATDPLTIPEGAVVVPGSRGISQPFAQKNNLALYAPIIVKYRDEKTDVATVLESSLR